MNIPGCDLARELKNLAHRTNSVAFFRQEIYRFSGFIEELVKIENGVRGKYENHRFSSKEENPHHKDFIYIQGLWSGLDQDFCDYYQKVYGKRFTNTDYSINSWMRGVHPKGNPTIFLNMVTMERLPNHENTRMQEWINLVETFKHTIEFDLKILAMKR